MDNQTIGERVRSFRKRRRMNQTALARLIRRSECWLIDLEQGKGDPKMSDIYQIAHVLKVRATDLMTDTFQPVVGNDASANGSSRQTITPATSTLIVESEEAQLRYDQGIYLARMRRVLYNGGEEPITRYLVRISVDSHPGDPDQSKKLYRKSPLTWEELNLSASCEGEPLIWTIKLDRDAEKEAYVHFRTPTGRPPAPVSGIDHDVGVQLHGLRQEVGELVPASHPMAHEGSQGAARIPESPVAHRLGN